MIPIDPKTKIPLNITIEETPESESPQGNEGIASSRYLRFGNSNDSDSDFEREKNSLRTGEVLFHNFNGYWQSEDLKTPSLKDINLRIAQNELLGITGRIGAGKSGLLGVILEEMPYYSGGFSKKGSVAYVEQEPVLFSDNIRDNVLFGKAFHQALY